MIIRYHRESANNENGKFTHLIKCEPTNSHSLASLVMLNDYYRRLEVIHYSRILHFDILNASEYKGVGNYGLLKILRKEFNSNFLRKSKLICVYCYTPVTIKEGKKSNNKQATIDHIRPLHDMCDWFDEKNLCVCCSKCNNEKGNMSYSEWKSYLTKF